MMRLFIYNSFLLTVLIIICGGEISAQTGINTRTPRATLDIVTSTNNSTIPAGLLVPKLSGSDLKAKDSNYGNNQNGTIVYVTTPLAASETTDKTLNVLDEGHYIYMTADGNAGRWRRMFPHDLKVISGGDFNSANTGNSLILNTNGSGSAEGTLVTRTFTLTRKSAIHITFSTPVTKIGYTNGNLIQDGSGRYISANISLVLPNNSTVIVARDAMGYTNSANSGIVGGFQLSGSRSFVLDPGTYTIRFQPLISTNNSNGLRAEFGLNSYTYTIFDIFAETLDRD